MSVYLKQSVDVLKILSVFSNDFHCKLVVDRKANQDCGLVVL